MKVLEPHEIEINKQETFCDHFLKLGPKEYIAMCSRARETKGEEYARELWSMLQARLTFWETRIKQWKDFKKERMKITPEKQSKGV